MRSVKKNTGRSFLNGAMQLLLCLLFPFHTFSQDSIPDDKASPVQLHGYIKNMQSAFFVDKMSSLFTGNLIHNRLNLRWDISNNVYLRAEARNRLYYGEQVKMTYGFGKYIESTQGIVDFSYNVIDDTSVLFNTTLDRILINWSNSKWDVSFGRQRINWGINLVWNPNDIFNAFNYFDFDYEERPGTDAFRIQYNTGKFSVLELAYKFSDKKDEHVGALLYKSNFRKYDLQHFAGVYFQDIVIGSGWAGNIKNTGFKGEISYFHPYDKATDEKGVLLTSVSFDRSFRKDYFAMVSYLYNSDAKDLLYSMNELAGTTLTAKKLMPFKHTFFAQASKSFHPLVTGSLAFMFSPQHYTLILLPTLTVSVADNWDLTLVGQSIFQDFSGVYRTLGNGIHFRLRWSF